MKRPAFQFYPGDWLRDANLRICSAGARALWIDLMAIMHQADPYGHLVFNGRALEVAQLARMIGETPKDVTRWLKELEDNGVSSRNEHGVLYSRRMVKDEAVRNLRARGGAAGADYGQRGGKYGGQGGRPPKQSTTPINNPPSDDTGGVATGVLEPPIKPPPSSSSSSSIETPSQLTPASNSVDKSKPVDGGSKSKPNATAGQWWCTPEGIAARGKQLGITAKPGESYSQLSERIRQEDGKRRQAA